MDGVEEKTFNVHLKRHTGKPRMAFYYVFPDFDTSSANVTYPFFT